MAKGQAYVKETATGAGTGLDWDNALGATDLEATIEAGGTVYIAAGTYIPAATIDLSTNVSHVIQGGFPTSATGIDLSGYDPAANPTIIDGGGAIRIFNNSARVDNIQLTGLVLQNANAVNGSAFSSTYVNASFPIEFIFSDLIVQNSVATGDGTFYIIAKTNSNSKVSFLNCGFNNNTAANGGGIYLESVRNSSNGATATPGNLVIDGCTFEDNSTTLVGGGALYLLFSHAWIIKHTDFCTNVATNARGGAIYMRTSGSQVIDSCFFSNNTTNEFGGAINASASCSASISNSMFVDNSSTLSGGAISASVSTCELDNTYFYNNLGANGGAIYSTSWYSGPDRSTVNNCIFSGNEALGAGTISGTNGGGAMCFSGTASFPNGWDIDSCTFVNNKAHASSWGGAISHGGIIETTITNSLFYNNTKGGAPNISGSDIKNLDDSGGFYIMSGNKMQLANVAAYTNQNLPTDPSSYAFTDDTFSNTDDGAVPAAPISPCITEFNITGTVFEDINYGGGDGRPYATADAQATGWSSIGLANVTVELYDNTGTFLKDTITNASGEYAFLDYPNGNYSVRVVNGTITSNRTSNATAETIIPVQTFRTDGTTDIIHEVGGAFPDLVDTLANTAFANLSTLTSASANIQSLTPITVLDNHVYGVDFGFCYDVIVNTNDSGQGSLRQFILNSNELDNTNLNQRNNPAGGVSYPKELGWEVSIFMIPGTGPHIIQPLTVLPTVEDANTELTGYTQDGSSQGPIAFRTINVELDGNMNLFNGINIYASDVVISGFSINSFGRGIYSNLNNSVNSFVWGNYIGTKADGLTIGTNSNTGINFYNINDSFIGTNGDNNNDGNEGNLISNSYFGIEIRGTNNNLIAGNYVGTDKTGMLDYGNQFIGIHIRDAIGTNYIGYKDSAINPTISDFINISSGNGTDGIRISNGDNQIIAGNYLGTNVSGTAAITNAGYGIQFVGITNNTVIGTNSNGINDAFEGNLISGNSSGIRFASAGSGSNNIIAGNYIGTDYTGNAPLPNLNNGININGPFFNNTIGTNGDNNSDLEERNIISGNIDDGIRIDGSDGNTLAGNFIGVGADGTTALGNGKRGVFIATSSANSFIGFDPAMANTNELEVGNRIENNNDAGIGLSGTGVQNRISRNQHANNAGLGIDLGYDGVSLNDNGDSDNGANNLLNFPVIDSVFLIDNDLTITGFAPAGSEIEFYIADGDNNPDPLPASYTSNLGEGNIFIDVAYEGGPNDVDLTTANYTDDGTGSTVTKTQNRFQFTFDVSGKGLTDNMPISALAIDGNNNTSEFGNVATLVNLIEICNNGIDDDGDGNIDCEDGDCPGLDTDGDGICNDYDLDDDNDGIPDLEEGHCEVFQFAFESDTEGWVQDNTNNGSSEGPTVHSSGVLTWEGCAMSNIPANPDGNFIMADDTYGQQMHFESPNNLNLDLSSKLNGAFSFNWIGGTYDGVTGTQSPAAGNMDVFLIGSGITINATFDVTGLSNVGVWTTFTLTLDDATWSGTAADLSTVLSDLDRIEIEVESITSKDWSVADCTDGEYFGLGNIAFSCASRDTDNDLVPDYLDLDSDNDGIYDVTEAGHGQSDINRDGLIDGASIVFGINGLFDGVETVADNGILNYAISDSETIPDGTYDAYEIDADGDNCFDTIEANRADSEQDGIAGTGIPDVNISGLINGLNYNNLPPNSNWQNPMVIVCCNAQAPTLTKN